MTISKVNIAVCAQMVGTVVEKIRVAIGAVAPTVVRVPHTEKLIAGKDILDTAMIEEAVSTIQTESCPIDDIRSTSGYRCEMTGVLLRRALTAIGKQGDA